MLGERFWSKVLKTSTCWVWTSNTNNKGYGMFSLGTAIGKKLAHRLSYEEANGKIPAGMHILHSCDNPLCVNPSHLRAGTRKDNMQECSQKGRYGNQKLSDANVISLLKDYVAGMDRAGMAAKYGISILSVNDYTTSGARERLHGKHGCPTSQQLKDARNLKPGAVLTPEAVLEIRAKLASGKQGTDLAEEYGIHKATISDIKLRKIWKDI